MNRNAITLVLAGLATALVLSACQRGADTNLNPSLTTNRNTVEEPVDTLAVEADLIKLERAWAGANKTKDAATVRNILADDIVLTYPDGATGTKSDEVGMVESGAITTESWDITDTKVTTINKDAAFITGRAIIKKGSLKDPKSGKTIDISGEYRFMDVYARRNGKWMAVASQTTKIAAPAAPSVVPPPPPAAKATPSATAPAKATPAKAAP